MPTLYLNQGRSKLKLHNKRKISVRLQFSFEVYERQSQSSEEIVYRILQFRKTIMKRITERQLGISRNHGGYGKLFSEWSGIENEMADGLQMGGHQLDRYNQQTNAILEEEGTVYIDQLKEYLFFTESLRAIVKKQQQKQYELEKAEEALSTKVAQRDEIQRQIQEESGEDPPPPPPGFSLKGISTILFGAETIEAKQEKLNELNKQVEEAEEVVRERQAEANLFVDRALKDYERFKKQKVRDLTEVMQNYIKMQIKLCKTGLQSWKSAKENFLTI